MIKPISLAVIAAFCVGCATAKYKSMLAIGISKNAIKDNYYCSSKGCKNQFVFGNELYEWDSKKEIYIKNINVSNLNEKIKKISVKIESIKEDKNKFCKYPESPPKFYQGSHMLEFLASSGHDIYFVASCYCRFVKCTIRQRQEANEALQNHIYNKYTSEIAFCNDYSNQIQRYIKKEKRWLAKNKSKCNRVKKNLKRQENIKKKEVKKLYDLKDKILRENSWGKKKT